MIKEQGQPNVSWVETFGGCPGVYECAKHHGCVVKGFS